VKIFVCVQPVHQINLSVTLVNACLNQTDVTDAVTAVTAVMNATAVSFELILVLA